MHNKCNHTTVSNINVDEITAMLKPIKPG